MNLFTSPRDVAGTDPWQPVRPVGQGSSAPVAIVLALALAATTGVSAQSWGREAPRVQPDPLPRCDPTPIR